MRKRIFALLMTMCMVISLTACGSSDSGGSASGGPDPEIKIDDIAWEVRETLDGSHRRLGLFVTNNSKYNIKRIKMTFKEKDGITEEQKNQFVEDLKKDFGDKLGSEKEQEAFKTREIGMNVTVRFKDDGLKPGENNENNPDYLDYYSGYIYVTNMSHYELVQPDIMEIRYVGEGNANNKISYDFISGNYTVKVDEKDNIEDQVDDMATESEKQVEEAVESAAPDNTQATEAPAADTSDTSASTTSESSGGDIVGGTTLENDRVSINAGYCHESGDEYVFCAAIAENKSGQNLSSVMVSFVVYDKDNKIISAGVANPDSVIEEGQKVYMGTQIQISNEDKPDHVEIGINTPDYTSTDAYYSDEAKGSEIDISDLKDAEEYGEIVISGKAKNNSKHKTGLMKAAVVLMKGGHPIAYSDTYLDDIKPGKTKKFSAGIYCQADYDSFEVLAI